MNNPGDLPAAFGRTTAFAAFFLAPQMRVQCSTLTLVAVNVLVNPLRADTWFTIDLTLSWHPDEAPALSRSEMLRAADETIRVLGAEDRQALIVCHTDRPHPHVHVILNRVSPEDGRMLKTGNDRLKLSQWALGYRPRWQEIGRTHSRERREFEARETRVGNGVHDIANEQIALRMPIGEERRAGREHSAIIRHFTHHLSAKGSSLHTP